MSDQNDDDYMYDELTGEWRPASEIAVEKTKAAQCATPPATCWPMASPSC